MAEDGDLIGRADSLINPEAATAAGDRRESSRRLRRRRSFIASNTPAEQPAQLTPPDRAADDEDLPVLTEVVSPAEAVPEATAADIDTGLRPMLAANLADLVDRQLRNDLPALIEAALGDAAEPLQRGLATTIETALRDFLTQRGQLRLPLEDPGSGPQGTPGAT
jgi:hypothetical protein